MTPTEALHTAARRYCEEHSQEWQSKYRQSSWSEAERYDIFPRYLVLDAIRVEIERSYPPLNSSTQETFQRLTHAIRSAQSESTLHLIENIRTEIGRRAMDQERERLSGFIARLSGTDLAMIEPLPFRRTLDELEAQSIFKSLSDRWGLDGSEWYPLLADPPPPNVLVFHNDYFHGKCRGADLVRTLLAERGIARVFELRQFRHQPACELDLSLMQLRYTGGGEGYWSSAASDWLIYVSHESSISLTGEWLVGKIKEAWPDWQERQYGGPFSTPDLRGAWDDEWRMGNPPK